MIPSYSVIKLSSPAEAHSERRLVTGFAIAVLMVCTLNVINAIPIMASPLKGKIYHLTSVRNTKPSSQEWIAHQASGVAIMKAVI